MTRTKRTVKDGDDDGGGDDEDEGEDDEEEEEGHEESNEEEYDVQKHAKKNVEIQDHSSSTTYSYTNQ